MRVSVEKTDPGYCQNGHNIRIFLDDVELKGVAITADEEEGKILRYAKDDSNNFVITEDGEHFKTEWVTGRVKIIVPEGWFRIP